MNSIQLEADRALKQFGYDDEIDFDLEKEEVKISNNNNAIVYDLTVEDFKHKMDTHIVAVSSCIVVRRMNDTSQNEKNAVMSKIH